MEESPLLCFLMFFLKFSEVKKSPPSKRRFPANAGHKLFLEPPDDEATDNIGNGNEAKEHAFTQDTQAPFTSRAEIISTYYNKGKKKLKAFKQGRGLSTRRVTLFTRPRRFGKTLALSMLQTFFEKEMDGDGKPVDKHRYLKVKKSVAVGRRFSPGWDNSL